jgi:dynein heavy chain
MIKGYKEIKFWDVQISEVSITVDAFFNQFISLINGLTNKKLEIIETTCNNINEFRRLLPVIDDLKNAAMKDRHWDEIRDIINK